MKSATNVIVFTAVFCAASIAAQTPKPTPVPTLSPDLINRFYKASADQANAQLEIEAAQGDKNFADEEWRAVVRDLTKACGDAAQAAQPDKHKPPVCVPKPPEPAASEKK